MKWARKGWQQILTKVMVSSWWGGLPEEKVGDANQKIWIKTISFSVLYKIHVL